VVIAGDTPGGTLREPPIVREPTSWSQPLQATVAAFYVATTVLFVATRIITAREIHDSITDQIAASPPQGVSPAQAANFANVVFGVGLALDVIVTLLFLLLAAVSYFRRWTWVFIANVVLIGLIAIQNALNVASSTQLHLRLPFISIVTAVAGAILFAGMVVALIRFGVWGCRRIPAASQS